MLSQECQASFEELKKRLVIPPVLAYPNFDVDFVLETDASHQGLGAVYIISEAGGWQAPLYCVCQPCFVGGREELWDN